MTDTPLFDPSLYRSDVVQETPAFMYEYLRRDEGSTSNKPYKHWRDVLETEASAKLWNQMTADFRLRCNSERQRDWLLAHWQKVIDERVEGKDKDWLRYKMAAHYVAARLKVDPEWAKNFD